MYVACIAGKAEAFLKAFAQTSYNLLKKMQAFTRFDLLKSKQFQLIKSRKTSALKKQRKNSSSRRPKKTWEYDSELSTRGQAWNLSVRKGRRSEGQGEHPPGQACSMRCYKRYGEHVPLLKLIQGPWSIKLC